MIRRAVVLMNLGGPDSPEAVRPFLYNLFSDKAIIRLPAPLRLPLAALIASRRAATARRDLRPARRRLAAARQTRGPGARAGAGTRPRSSLLRGDALLAPADRGGGIRGQSNGPRTRSCCCRSIRNFRRRRTASSLAAWKREASRQGIGASTRTLRSYPDAAGFIAALASAARKRSTQPASRGHPVRLLFSAHGLPERIVRRAIPIRKRSR